MILEMADIHVRRGRRTVLQGLDFVVPKGAVVGLLGPNGAGKSTTIRAILGLERPVSGSIHLFGRSWSRSSLSRVGASVDGPSFYGHLTGRQNLQAHATLIGAGAKDIRKALEEAGIAQHQDRRARLYSTGMKSRLATAMALLGDPEFVILDEPQNGLDPEGILEVRQRVRQIADEGRTVLFSSHVLSEVSTVTDYVTCIADGRVLFSGPTADFTRSSSLEEAYLARVREQSA